MILHQFPDLQWLKSQARARFNNRQGVGGITLPGGGWPNVILNTRTHRAVRDNIRGPLSIFTNLSGNSTVTVGRKRVRVTPESFFVSNAGQDYTLEVDGPAPVETFNIHFGESFAEEAFRSLLSSPGELLERQDGGGNTTTGFHNRILPSSAAFKSLLAAISASGSDKLLLEEKLFHLLTMMVSGQKSVLAMQERLSAVKHSTKEEIMKRLISATDYLYSFYHQNPGLDELAAISCLSKFHFLRLFRMAYGQTPHQFTTSLKIARAQELLKATDDGINKIADSLGFKSSSTFSRLFFLQTGFYPTQYRAPTKSGLKGKSLKFKAKG